MDGPEVANDELRGAGTFRRVLENLDGGRDRLFHCTVTRRNIHSLQTFVDFLNRRRAAGVLFGLYSPRKGEVGGWALDAAEQEAAVQTLVRLQREYAIVLNTPASLELMRPKSGPVAAAACIYRSGEAISLDHRLDVKHPCSYGAGADCSRCGCAALFLRAAAEVGDRPSRDVLSALFRRNH